MAPQQDTIKRTLRDLDLSDNEAVLYIQMLTHPTNTVQELTTRAPFPRTMLYYVLKGLMEKGLVTAKKKKWKTVYIAESPERLYDLLSAKEREFNREREQIVKLIPTLKHRYLLSGKRPAIRMFDGVEEYAKALEDSIISKPDEILAFETLSKKQPALVARLTHEKRRVSKRIRKKTLFFEDAHALRTLAGRPYDDFSEFRAIRNDSVESFDANLLLYSGKLLYTSYYDEHEPSAILIEDHALFRMQQQFFELLWQSGVDRTLMCAKP